MKGKVYEKITTYEDAGSMRVSGPLSNRNPCGGVELVNGTIFESGPFTDWRISPYYEKSNGQRDINVIFVEGTNGYVYTGLYEEVAEREKALHTSEKIRVRLGFMLGDRQPTKPLEDIVIELGFISIEMKYAKDGTWKWIPSKKD